MLKTYATISEKDTRFHNSIIHEFCVLHTQLQKLESNGFVFRGQADASWSLYTSSQREYITKDLKRRFNSPHDFVKMSVAYQTRMAVSQYVDSCKRVTDVSALSVMQHYGAPSPFLDFTTRSDVALHFASNNAPGYGCHETNAYISIYAFLPGSGPSTANNNDMSNWEDVVDRAGGDDDACTYDIIKDLQGVYIREDSGKYLAIANPRLDLQNGLFVFSGLAHANMEPYEVHFTGYNANCVKLHTFRLFLPKFTCFNIHKCLLPKIRDYLSVKKISEETLGLDGTEWARTVYERFLAESQLSVT